MLAKRHVAFGLALVVALGLAGLAAACSDEEEGTSQVGTPAAASDLQQAMDQVSAMRAAAQEGDLEAAQGAFEDGHDPLHEVIEDLEAGNPDLAAELDKAVDDAEKDFDEGADADHIVEIGNEILDLLEQAD
jgi:hypothetical protein